MSNEAAVATSGYLHDLDGVPRYERASGHDDQSAHSGCRREQLCDWLRLPDHFGKEANVQLQRLRFAGAEFNRIGRSGHCDSSEQEFLVPVLSQLPRLLLVQRRQGALCADGRVEFAVPGRTYGIRPGPISALPADPLP